MTRRATARRAGLTTGCVVASLALATGTALAAEAGSPGIGDPYYPTDGNGGYDVADYDVNVSYDPPSQHLDGTTKIAARATQDLDRFNLDLHKLNVRSVTVDGEPAQFSRAGDHELVVNPKDQLSQDESFDVEVVYDGKPEPIEDSVGTGGWQTSQSGGAFAAGQPHSASAWYPVNDHPRDKAKFHLAARVPEGWKVVSNGTERSTGTADGWTTSEWASENPMASYLTTIGVDKWDVRRSQLSDGTPVVDAYAPGAEAAERNERRLPEILDFLSSKFGEYPHASAGGIFLADPIGFSLETQTRPVYTVKADLDTIVHEQAHQWYGDSVSIDKWRDICQNECFASYAQWMWQEEKEGQNLDQKYRDAVRTESPEFWSGKLVDMGQGEEFTSVYDKGQLAVHALRRQIGEPAFDRVLKEWPQLHRGGNAHWEQFEQLTERISGQDLDGFFQEWFHGDRIPSEQYLWPGPLHP